MLALCTRVALVPLFALSSIFTISTVFSILAIQHNADGIAAADNLYATFVLEFLGGASRSHAPFGNGVPLVVGALSGSDFALDPHHFAVVVLIAFGELGDI